MSFLSAMWAALKGEGLPTREEFAEHDHRISDVERKVLDIERKLEIKRALRSLTGEDA